MGRERESSRLLFGDRKLLMTRERADSRGYDDRFTGAGVAERGKS